MRAGRDGVRELVEEVVGGSGPGRICHVQDRAGAVLVAPFVQQMARPLVWEVWSESQGLLQRPF